MQLYSYSDAILLNNDLAEQITNSLKEAIKLRGHAYLVVSGGKTPVTLFQILAQKKIPWERVTVTLADERCVALKDNARNERLVHEFLLQHEAQKAQFISLYDEDADNFSAVEAQIASLPTFDVVILGMGEDGHTASLFPCSSQLAAGLDDSAQAIVQITPESAAHQRISLSKKRLLNSHNIVLHLIGPKKQAALNQAMAERDPMAMPIRAFLNDSQANLRVMYAPH